MHLHFTQTLNLDLVFSKQGSKRNDALITMTYGITIAFV